MRLYILLGVFLLYLSVQGQQSRKALFLGNSYTTVNNLPQLIADIAANMGDTFQFDMSAPGGYTLGQHLGNNSSTSKVKNGVWDYVIMQEQSQLPAFGFYDTYPALSLCSLTRKHNPCARIFFYRTWGRKNGDAGNCAAWPPVCTYRGMDSMLHMRYLEMAQANETGLAPVGQVWKYVREHYPSIELYQADGSHPSLAGSYLAACCFYTSFFKRLPTLITYNPGISSTEATAIREATKLVVYDSLSTWDFGHYTPQADFIYSIGSGNNEVVITNKSRNTDSTLWDFGDGNRSVQNNPRHEYLLGGLYTIQLSALNCDLDTTYISVKQVNVRFCAHDPRIYPDNLTLCPGVKDTIWTQAYDAYQWIDGNGMMIPGENNRYLLPEPMKYYRVQATQNGCTEMSPEVFVGTYAIVMTHFFVAAYGNLIGTDTACIGDTILLALTPNKPPYPLDHKIQWYKDGLPIPSSANDSLRINSSAMYKVVLGHPECPAYKVYENEQLFTFIQCQTSVPEKPESAVLSVYPNPFYDELNIQLRPGKTGLTYHLSDVYGRLLLIGRLDEENNTIQLHDLSKGLYILQVEQEQLKVIKSH